MLNRIKAVITGQAAAEAAQRNVDSQVRLITAIAEGVVLRHLALEQLALSQLDAEAQGQADADADAEADRQ